MTMHTFRLTAAIGGTALIVAALAGCAMSPAGNAGNGGNGHGADGKGGAGGGGTSHSASPSPTTSSPAGSPAPSQPALRSGQCQTPSLSGSVAVPSGAGSAGHTELEIVLTNTGSASCTLQGWPGTSFVGDGNGTQIGAAATFDKASPHGTVTLAAGGTAHALVSVADAQALGASCSPHQVDGFRIFPPGETRSLFIDTASRGLTGCSNQAVNLLEVQALQPGT